MIQNYTYMIDSDPPAELNELEPGVFSGCIGNQYINMVIKMV